MPGQMDNIKRAQDKENISDSKPVVGRVTPVQEKQDFKDPFKEQADQLATRKNKADDIAKKVIDSQASQMVDKANAALSGSTSKFDMKEFEELEKISDEDLELAEQTIFKGYAELNITIPNMPKHTFTLCTTSAEDMSIIDEILYDMVKGKEDKDGEVDLPAQHVQTMRAALFLALGFKGTDGKDFCDEPINQLATIKKAVIKVKDLECSGEIDKSIALMKSLKDSVKYRAVRMRRFPTPVIDFLSGKKYEFDNRMYTIMVSPKIIPKSSDQSQGTQERVSSTKEEISNTAQ